MTSDAQDVVAWGLHPNGTVHVMTVQFLKDVQVPLEAMFSEFVTFTPPFGMHGHRTAYLMALKPAEVVKGWLEMENRNVLRFWAAGRNIQS